MKKRIAFLSILSFILIIFSLASINADSTVATWTKVYCLYNSGSEACSNQVSGDGPASCSISNKCAVEGGISCYVQTLCECSNQANPDPCDASGYSVKAYASNPVYTVNWDNNQADCNCKMGAGRWGGIQFDGGLSPSCCGDDTSENYAAPSNSKSCDGSTACCNASATNSFFSVIGACVQRCPSITNVYFADMNGNPVTQVDYNDMVQLIAETADANDTMVNFTLSEATNCYPPETYKVSPQNGKAVTSVRVKRCNENNGGTLSLRAFFSFSNDPQYNKETQAASTLTVSPTEKNEWPIVNITSPHMSDIFPLANTIDFISSSYDVDDGISTTLWEFGDTATSSDAVTTHQYGAGGPKMVKLTVTDSRGASNSSTIGILIDDPAVDDFPLAIISKPKSGTIYPGPNPLIEFDATASRDDSPFDQLKFTWTFDEGTPFVGQGMAGAQFSRIFSRGGQHDVNLVVSDTP